MSPRCFSATLPSMENLPDTDGIKAVVRRFGGLIHELGEELGERPLVLPNGAGLYALNCGGPAYLLKTRDIEESYGPRLVEIARKVASLVGVKGRK